MLRVLELPFMYHNDSTYFTKRGPEQYFEFIYLVIITITTVGYGDFDAKTLFGRIIICLISLWGAILMALIIGIVSNFLDL